MNKEKYQKSLDKIKPSEELIRKTIMNIENKKKKNFVPFYLTGLALACSLILVTTYILNKNTTNNDITNNDTFLNEITGEYTFEHVFDFNTMSKENFNNIYVLKYGNKIEDNDYTIPYEYYVDFIEILKGYKDKKITTLQEFNIENYDQVVINNEQYFYIKENQIIYYDTNKVYYSIDIENDIEPLNKIKTYIDNFTRMRSIENFIEQTYIKNVSETNYRGMYLVEITNNNGQWESYMRTKEYSDYKELMSYIERLRNNNVIKNEKGFDVSKYYGNMLIQFDGFYMYIPETINGKILLYVSGWVNPIYYEIELQQKDYNTLESIKNMIKTKGIYESAYGMHNPETKELVDPYVNENRITNVSTGNTYSDIWIKGSNNLYVKFKVDAIKNDKYHPLNTTLEENKEYLIYEHIRSYEATFVGKNDFPVIVYVTQDKKVRVLKLEDAIKNGNVECSYEIKLQGNAIKVETGTSEEGYSRIYAVLEDGKKVELDI